MRVLRFDIDIVTDSELSLDLVGSVQTYDSAVGHDADAVSELISLLDVLGAHDD